MAASKRPLWRIIRDMADLRDIRNLVRLVNQLAVKEENTEGYPKLNDGTHVIGSPNRITVRKEFTKRKWRGDRGPRRVETIIGMAYPVYLKSLRKTEHGVRYDAFQLTKAGDKLLSRSFMKILPKGLILAWVKENKDFSTLVIAFISGIVIGSFGIGIAIIGLRKDNEQKTIQTTNQTGFEANSKSKGQVATPR